MVGEPHHQITDFQNPVYAASFPDPFVLEHDGVYYAYSTGIGDDDKVFPAAVSWDLVSWRPIGGVMPRLDRDSPHYWAPEVAYSDGRFYLYYSVGNEEWMELRVAVSDRPDGGFEDADLKLTREQFAIDAHVFRDDDGSRYMFYATDFLDYDFIGTGVVVDRLLDPFTLDGNPRPAARARYDWQVYDPQRKEKGGVRWHTVEGPSVVKRKGRYFMTFSGGNWQNQSYGVGFAVSRSLTDPDEWMQSCDGTECLPILRSVPERILGPGHNSITLAPNGRDLICVYHEWQNDERRMAIDRMEILADRVLIIGPTDSPQPAPNRAQDIDQLDGWDVSCGCWSDGELGITAGPDSTAGLQFRTAGNSFLFRSGIHIGQGNGRVGVSLHSGSAGRVDVIIAVDGVEANLRCEDTDGRNVNIMLPDFRRDSLYQFRIEVDERIVTAFLDGRRLGTFFLPEPAESVQLIADGPEAVFSGNRITYGFEELFFEESLPARGWQLEGGCSHEDMNLVIEPSAGKPGSIRRAVTTEGDFELSVNLRSDAVEAGSEIRILCGSDTSLKFDDTRWKLFCGAELVAELTGYSLEVFRQLRIVSRGGAAEAFIDDRSLGPIPIEPARSIELVAECGTWEIDMVRYTNI